ncbi:MAG: clindamycin resistance transfer factor btgA, partial [Flavobacterium sp.]
MKTIGVSDSLHLKLKRYCDKNNLKLGEFIETSLNYLEKNGINPAEHESPAVEIQRLIKRVDQVVAFIKKQESDLLRPMVESVSLSENRIQKELTA